MAADPPSTPPDDAPGRPRARAKPRRGDSNASRTRKVREATRGLRPGQTRPDTRRQDLPEDPGQRELPAVTYGATTGIPIRPERYSDAWWDLHDPPPLPEDAPTRAPAPPPGYRYRMDGYLVPLIQTRQDLSTPEGQALFLEVLGYTGSQRAAMDACGIASRQTVEKHLDEDKAFAEQYDAALNRHRDMIYVAAVQRAVHGVEKPIIGGQFKDTIVAYERVYSDTLTALLLKGHFEKFRNTDKPSVTVNTQNNTQVNVDNRRVDYKKLSREDRMKLRAMLKPAQRAELDAKLAEQVKAEEAQEQEERAALPAAVTEDAIEANCEENK